MIRPLSLILGGLAVIAAFKCPPPKDWTPTAPEKRAARASIAIKALLAGEHFKKEGGSEFIAEFLVLDVYKGADKLALHSGLKEGTIDVRNS